MGGSQSTRKLTVDNDNAIQVSQEALDRIQGQLSTQQTQTPPPASVSEPLYVPPPPQYFDSQKTKNNLAAEEAYWNRRIENLKKAHEQINATMEIEYKKTLIEASDLFKVQKEKIATKLPPCQEEKAKVVQCYSSNPDKSLLCSVLVNQFNDCVCRSRISAVTAS